MPKKKSDDVKTTTVATIGTIIVAVIGLIGTLAVAYWQFVWKPARGSQPAETEYLGHVLDTNTLEPIAGAKITLTLQGVPPIVYTDSEGVYRFTVAIDSSISGQVRVDAPGYQVYTRTIAISTERKTIEDIRLTPLSP